jgi:hypothetical protein
MVVRSAGFRPKSDCFGKAQKQLYSKLQTRPFVREGSPHQETRNRQTENKNLVTPRQTSTCQSVESVEIKRETEM